MGVRGEGLGVGVWVRVMARTSGSAQACCGVTSAVRSESDLKRNSCQAEGDGGEGG